MQYTQFRHNAIRRIGEQMNIMKVQTAAFDTSAYLDSEDAITAYLNEVLRENDPDLLLTAIGNIAKALSKAKVDSDARGEDR